MTPWPRRPAPRVPKSPAGPDEVPGRTGILVTAVAIGDERALKFAEVAARHQAFAPDPRHVAVAHAADRAPARFPA